MNINTKDERTMKVIFSPKETDEILRNIVRKYKDEKTMSGETLKLIKCNKKDNISLSYQFKKDGSLIIKLIDKNK